TSYAFGSRNKSNGGSSGCFLNPVKIRDLKRGIYADMGSWKKVFTNQMVEEHFDLREGKRKGFGADRVSGPIFPYRSIRGKFVDNIVSNFGQKRTFTYENGQNVDIERESLVLTIF